MRRLIAVGAVLFVVAGGAVSLAQPIRAPRRECQRTFTVAMARRAARAVFAGDRRPSRRGLRVLDRIERCQRNPQARAFVRWVYRREGARHAQRVRSARDANLPQALASWYDDSGSTACGFHAGYGVAHKTLACGTHVLICYPVGSSRCVETTVDDRGPYVGGRTWDLDRAVKDALGFDGVQTVSYRIG